MKINNHSLNNIDRIIQLLVFVALFFTPLIVQGKDYVIINKIMYDSPLNEQIATGAAYSNGEFVELFNAGVDPVNLNGWVLRGGGVTEIYSFPSNTLMAPKSYLIVAYQYNKSGFTLDQLYTGLIASPDHQIQYQRKIILSNSGEPIYLRDNTGMTKDSIYYDGNSNSSKLNRLSADNADGLAGNSCICLQRKTTTYNANGNAIPNNMEWISATVNPFQQNTAYNPPFIPGIKEIALSDGQNYIISVTPLDKTGQVHISNGQVTLDNDARGLIDIQYFDGLGRSVQAVQQGITPGNADLVTYTDYDDVGRESIHWLPTPVTNNKGAFVEYSVFKNTAISSHASDQQPFTETIYEPSPLNRIQEQYGAGNSWKTNYKRTQLHYETNDASIAYFYVNNSNQLVKGANYAANTLYVTQTEDEDGKTVTEYKNKTGQVVMKRSSSNVDTYYVYNDLVQLCYVIPPEASDKLTEQRPYTDSENVLKQYCYLYQYDERGNCRLKQLPGCEPINMVYDLANRLILSQDGNQRVKSPIQWTITKYDILGRVLYTGIINREISQYEKDIVHNNVIIESTGTTNQLSNTGYTCNLFVNEITPLIVSYYDNYSFLPNGNSLIYDDSQVQNGYTAKFSNATGLLTGARTYMLDGSGNYNTSAMYYDDKRNVVQTRSTNHLNGYDFVYSQYDFTGKVLKTYKTHGINGASDTYKELYMYTYDNGQRPKTSTYSLNGATAVTLASSYYDELGRLQTKTISNGIDVTNYSYNIQGHITEINGTNFLENLYYNTNTANLPNFTSCFNGNIAGMKWSLPNEQLGYQRAYSFAYDDLNRLTNSVYSGNNSNQIVSGTLGKYNEKLDYQDDKTVNLKGLIRYENGSLVENLNLVYQGNQIQKVDNSLSHFVAYGSELFRDYDNHIVIPREYAYDTNGNMLYDANNGVSDIEYNVLNSPNKVHFTAGHKNQYTYDAGGQKLRVVNYSSNQILDIPMGTITPLSSNPSDYTILTTDYVGNMIYENGALKEILLPEGYYQNGTFYYYLKDHLGDNRVTINSSGAVVEKSHYYPSGTRFFTESTNNDLKPLPYRYNGKELEAMNGLNQMDYGARRRFSWAPIWTSVDPMAEKYYSISPYAYCAGNPVNLIDPNGEDVYLLTWASYNGNIGHSGIAVDNYKTETVKDKDGNIVTDENGNEVTQQVKDGTVTYFDLWPGGEGANKNNATEDITAFYNEKITTLSDLKKTDVSVSEGRLPDGIVSLKTSASTDELVNMSLSSHKNANLMYNGLNNNCSDYAKAGVEYAAPSGHILGNTDERIGSKKATTPNYLYNATLRLPNAKVLKSAGKKTSSAFLDAVVGKTGVKRTIANIKLR